MIPEFSAVVIHSVVTVTDEADRVIAEKRLPNDLAKIAGLAVENIVARQPFWDYLLA